MGRMFKTKEKSFNDLKSCLIEVKLCLLRGEKLCLKDLHKKYYVGRFPMEIISDIEEKTIEEVASDEYVHSVIERRNKYYYEKKKIKGIDSSIENDSEYNDKLENKLYFGENEKKRFLLDLVLSVTSNRHLSVEQSPDYTAGQIVGIACSIYTKIMETDSFKAIFQDDSE